METQTTKSHTIIVSAFGRGHWLASEIVKRGLEASLIDVTEAMGRWAPDDWEGPFGFFKSDEITPSQIERFVHEETQEEIQNGFCVWLKSGPLEMKNAGLTKHRLNAIGLDSHNEDYIIKGEASAKKIEELGFNKNWLAQLSSILFSNIYKEHGESFKKLSSPNLYAPFLVRQASRPGFERSLDWCKANGVQVYKKSQVLDFSLGDKTVLGLEVQSETTKLVRSDQIVWMLSSEETQFMNPKLMDYLFPKGTIEPDWCWVRYRLKLTESSVLNEIPIHLVILEELEFPWTHENLLILQKTLAQDQYDLWFRIPYAQRFQMNYLNRIIERAIHILKNRIPLLQAEVIAYPQEYQYSYDEVGPCLFPVYKEKNLKKLVLGKSKNISYDGPEFWPYLGWNGQIKNQFQIMDKIYTDWRRQEEIRKKKNDR